MICFYSKSEGLEFDSHCWLCLANFSFHTASAYPAVMGTWLMKSVSGVAQAALILVQHVLHILPGEVRLLKWCVSYTREGIGHTYRLDDVRYQTLNYVPNCYNSRIAKFEKNDIFGQSPPLR